MFARVIPLQRTPLGVEGFDYRIPEEMMINVGDLVWIPFRRGKIVGLVERVMKSSAFGSKALSIVDHYANIHFPESVIRLLHWTAARTFCSKPTVLKAWLRNLPKKPIPLLTKERLGEVPSSTGKILAHWLLYPQTALTERTKKALEDGQRVLIVTPWKTRAERFHQELTNSLVLDSDLNDGDSFKAWTSFMNDEIPCLIATRLGAWLAPLADLVLLDEPENDEHKQDELAPRYDARLMLAWCQKNAEIHLESFGLTPPLHTQATGPDIPTNLRVNILRPNGYSKIPMIQADTLESIKEYDGHHVIIHPIRGWSARLVCRDCHWRAVCDHCSFPLNAERDHTLCHQCGKKTSLPEACPKCDGVELNKSFPGVEKLKTAWAKNEPETEIEWRNLSNEDLETPFPQGALVVVTDAHLLAGATEDIRRRERQCLYFRRLASRVSEANGQLLLQCDEASALDWSAWLSASGLTQFQQTELEQRRLFQYPPATRLVKVIVSGQTLNLEKLAPVRGPFVVKFRPSSSRQRSIYHLLFPPQTTEKELIQKLTPLAQSAIIDLDPVAFLK